MMFIRSLCFYVLFYVGTALMLLVFLPCVVIQRPLFVPEYLQSMLALC
jgi:hypothetical protein